MRKIDADRKGHFNDDITRFLFCLALCSAFFLNRYNGEGNYHPSRQKSSGYGCSDLWESEKQSQWPRRRLFQVHSAGRAAAFLVFITWGQHFSKMPHTTTGYSLSWGCECLALLPAWPPDCLPACPAAAAVVGHGPPISLSLTCSLCLSLGTHHIATHALPIDHPQNCPQPLYISVTTHWKAYRYAESYFRNKVILSRWWEFLDVVLKIPFG